MFDFSKLIREIRVMAEKLSTWKWICPYISRHLLSLNPLQ
ncbi:dimethyl sulfoxide reductase subunit B, partial [Shigella dysenteriae]